MSLQSKSRLTCAIYRMTRGDTYPPTEIWSLVTGAGSVPCLRSVVDRSERLEDGTVNSFSIERVRMAPRDVTVDDRLLIDGDVYLINSDEDIADLGREFILDVKRLPDGTAGEMGIS